MDARQLCESDLNGVDAPRTSDASKLGVYVWQDRDRVEFAVRTEDDIRRIVIGRLGNGLCITAIFTMEGKYRRLLSARNALPQEEQYYERSSGFSPNKVKQVNVDLPLWMVKALDKEAQRRGLSRKMLVKTWLVQRLFKAESTSS